MSHPFWVTDHENNLKKPQTIRIGLGGRVGMGMNIQEKEAEGPDTSPTSRPQGSSLPKGRLMPQ